MDIVQKITIAIEPSLDAMGYGLVQVKLSDGARRKTLTIMAERQDNRPMGFDDCTEISRMVSALMEVEDPITGAYDLEVCSPGLDRPLTKPMDYKKYAGYEAKIETLLPMEGGRKRFRGAIAHADERSVRLKMPEGDIEIGFNNIRQAKLVMTDELVQAELKQQKKKKG